MRGLGRVEEGWRGGLRGWFSSVGRHHTGAPLAGDSGARASVTLGMWHESLAELLAALRSRRRAGDRTEARFGKNRDAS